MQRINCVLQLSFEKALPPLKQVSVPLPHQMQEKLLVLVFQIMCGMRERLGEFVLAADVFDCWQSFFLSKLSRGYEGLSVRPYHSCLAFLPDRHCHTALLRS